MQSRQSTGPGGMVLLGRIRWRVVGVRACVACLAPLSAPAQAAQLDTPFVPADSAIALPVPLASADDAARAPANDVGASVAPMPSFAFYYGAHVPVTALSSFDSVVVEPDSDFDPRAADTSHTAWLAYVSLGEVSAARTYFKDIPRAWLRGENRAWRSAVVDQAVPQWPAFYVEHVIAPLWDKGFRGFFLDTLDSYQIVAKTDDERARQRDGIVAVIDAIKARYPGARLILNRGFELLPRVHEHVYAVAFESLYRGWNQSQQRYTEVTQDDRAWLMAQVAAVKAYGLPVVSIDYCPPADGACARETVERIRAAGVIPYVTGPALDSVGVGAAGERLRAGAFAQRRATRAERSPAFGVPLAAPRSGHTLVAGGTAAQAGRDVMGGAGAHAAGPGQRVHGEADCAI
ncbi:Hypothetical-related protein [Burkholderia sp. lig30]|uniref:endo alpha-1,4 polygalactosaminidase n=1 Tax=Burkholderia sp. lig30 TaxID=1192124 RepID=UPI00046100DA|nr:Hypothetical-related protein [Burkholderia sp. lig30]